MRGYPPTIFAQVFILLDLHLRSSVGPRRRTDSGDPAQTKPTQRPLRAQRTLRNGPPSVSASPGAVEKELDCPFVRKDRDWKCVW